MFVIALIAAAMAFAAARKPKAKPKGRRSPFTDDTCTELVDEDALELWAERRLRTEWEAMLDEGYDPFPDEETEVNMLVATDDLLLRTLPAGCYEADTDAYADLYRMTWCAIQMHLVDEGVLDLNMEYLVANCANEDFDPRELILMDDEPLIPPDEDEDELPPVVGDALYVEMGFPFVIGTDPPCSQLAPPGILEDWADNQLYPGYLQSLEALGYTQVEGERDHQDVVYITDQALVFALPQSEPDCYGAPTPAYAALFRWAYCIIAEQLALDGYIGEDPADIAIMCAAMPDGWDPRTDGPPAEVQGAAAAFSDNPAPAPRGPKLGKIGQLQLANPGGMIVPTVSVSDVLLTGQMMDAHCPGSRTHPCIVDDRVVQPRPNPGCRPCGG